MQWGDEYRQLHSVIYRQCVEVLQPGGLVLLNMKDHRRSGVWQYVTEWHLEALRIAGLRFVTAERIDVPGHGHGQNLHDRIDFETLLILRKP